MNLPNRTAAAIRDFQQFVTRGRSHSRRLDELDIRIAVTGVRGKSTTVSWLYEALVAREVDVYAKVTGDAAHSLYDGNRYPIERSGPVRLYETEAEIRRFDPDDAIVIENQGIRAYTSRLINTDYVDANIVVLTNVRRDHLDTLGRNPENIARALSRSVPAGARVVCGEGNEGLREYIERELDRRNGTLIPAFDPHGKPITPAEELLAIVDTTLTEAGYDQLSAIERREFRDRMRFEWTVLPEGRALHAAAVNDVESTERVRQALDPSGEKSIQPLVYFRADRPGRTASFIDYLNRLADRGVVDKIHAVGAHETAATRQTNVPVVWHDQTSESASSVLDAALAEGDPVLTMANTVPEFMDELQAAIEERKDAHEPEPEKPKVAAD